MCTEFLYLLCVLCICSDSLSCGCAFKQTCSSVYFLMGNSQWCYTSFNRSWGYDYVPHELLSAMVWDCTAIYIGHWLSGLKTTIKQHTFTSRVYISAYLFIMVWLNIISGLQHMKLKLFYTLIKSSSCTRALVEWMNCGLGQRSALAHFLGMCQKKSKGSKNSEVWKAVLGKLLSQCNILHITSYLHFKATYYITISLST